MSFQPITSRVLLCRDTLTDRCLSVARIIPSQKRQTDQDPSSKDKTSTDSQFTDTLPRPVVGVKPSQNSVR